VGLSRRRAQLFGTHQPWRADCKVGCDQFLDRAPVLVQVGGVTGSSLTSGCGPSYVSISR
jgi:hypothetical protein